MRVLLSTDAVGGVWDYSMTLAAALVQRGHHVLLAVLGPPDAAQGRSLPSGVELTAADFPLEWMPAADAELRPTAEWLAGVARSWGADLAHLNQMAYPAFDLGLPTVVVAHSDVLSWLGEVRQESRGEEWNAYTRRIGAGLRAATRVVAPSGYQGELLLRHYGRGADRVIHNGTAPAPAPAGRAREPLVISAGRAWDEAKGMDLLDDALLALGAAAPVARLFGVMEGPAGERFTPRALEAAGSVPPAVLGEWMERAAVYVAASRYEPFGLAPLQAAARGCPLVLSDIGSFRELWDGCALFFRSGSPASLAEALRAALSDPGAAAARAEAARERAVTRYSAARMVDEYLELYHGTLEAAHAVAVPLET